ncbi:Leucine rich repeat-containing protein [Eubacterium uniforme]|uniref:Leucine rich repeat-containing protein n=1 Tax=Eubacterium uniforme TaxID=39495 RepID=A0A1T4W5H8_9FIRM|nr:leucine-rich repeat domain-containing protein [Eubacterium uniforme]SKA72502.1 Leucine rich repeat-containing protein [Eubacterium uniforme]
MRNNKIIRKILCLIMIFVLSVNVSASETVNVKINKKTNTAIVSGKGAMAKKMTYAGNKKIKKVIIKNKVTSISAGAFKNCNKLKSVKFGKKVKKIGRFAFAGTQIRKLTLPKSVKNIGIGAFQTKKSIKTVKMPGKIKTKTVLDYEKPLVISNADNISFTTNLNLDTLLYVNAKNYKVSDKDKNYSSEDGVVYSKDGKKAVRLPNREKVEISSKCEEFDVFSYMYAYFYGDDYYEFECDKVKEIVIPKSVTKVTDGCDTGKLYYDYGMYKDKANIEKIEIKNLELDESSLEKLESVFANGCEVEKTETSIILKKK